MASKRLTFSGAFGDELAARLDLPVDGEPAAYALFAHCFTCSKDLRAVGNIARALNAEGIGVLRFDFTGLGESEGDFADTNFSSNIDDLVAAADFMEKELEAPRILLGHSLGGAAVLAAARRIPAARAVATIGAPADPSHVLRHVEESREVIEERGEAEVTLAGRTFTIRKQFLEDLGEATLRKEIEGLDRALLIFHSPLDEIVGIDNAARIYEAAKHPKSFISLDEADHLLTDEEDSRYVGSVLAAWARKYIELREPPSRDELADTRRIAVRTGASGLRTEIRVRGHALVADEPESVGGTDTGPTPYDLLAAALGACTSMTLRMYADRKEWPLDEVVVGLRHDRIHADDEEACGEREDSRVDRFRRAIRIEGALDPDQRSRLLEIADRCPVHRTLEAGVRIETEEVTGGGEGEGK